MTPEQHMKTGAESCREFREANPLSEYTQRFHSQYCNKNQTAIQTKERL